MEWIVQSLKRSKLAATSLISSRCFYNSSITSSAALKHELCEGWKNVVNNREITMAMFPVTRINDDRSSAMCCHFMFFQAYDINDVYDSDDDNQIASSA